MHTTKQSATDPAKIAARFWKKVDKRDADECWPWLAAVRRKDEGYGAFYYHGRHRPAPRIALILSGIEIPPSMVVCHKCDNPSCVNPAHLFIGTPQENDADRVAKGRQAKGSKNGFAKLTEFQVWSIRQLRRIGAKPGHIARLFGITGAHVWDLCKNNMWRHIDDEAMRKQAIANYKNWKANAKRPV